MNFFDNYIPKDLSFAKIFDNQWLTYLKKSCRWNLKKCLLYKFVYIFSESQKMFQALFLFVQLTHLYLYWHKYITSKNSVIVPHHNILHITRYQNIVIIMCHIKRQTSTLSISFMENLFFVCSQGVIDVCSCFTNIF